MKIIEQYTETKQVPNLKIKEASYVGDYIIRLKFNNGANKIIDFKDFLETSLHPSIKKYRNENLFSQFKIINGNLNWNDYDLIFPIDDLYTGKL